MFEVDETLVKILLMKINQEVDGIKFEVDETCTIRYGSWSAYVVTEYKTLYWVVAFMLSPFRELLVKDCAYIEGRFWYVVDEYFMPDSRRDFDKELINPFVEKIPRTIEGFIKAITFICRNTNYTHELPLVRYDEKSIYEENQYV